MVYNIAVVFVSKSWQNYSNGLRQGPKPSCDKPHVSDKPSLTSEHLCIVDRKVDRVDRNEWVDRVEPWDPSRALRLKCPNSKMLS